MQLQLSYYIVFIDYRYVIRSGLSISNPPLCCLSSVTFVHPIIRGLKLSAIFLRHCVYLGHPVTSVQNFTVTEIFPKEPLRRRVKRKRGTMQNRAIIDLSKAIAYLINGIRYGLWYN